MPVTSALQLARQTAQRHHPVLGPDGNLIGYFDAAALPPRLPQDRSVRQFTQPLGNFAAVTPALRCLQTLRKSGTPMAVVTNGSSRGAGVITLGALVSRILNLPKKADATR
jgi:CBS domain containing-hemolysin-like protein